MILPEENLPEETKHAYSLDQQPHASLWYYKYITVQVAFPLNECCFLRSFSVQSVRLGPQSILTGGGTRETLIRGHGFDVASSHWITFITH